MIQFLQDRKSKEDEDKNQNEIQKMIKEKKEQALQYGHKIPEAELKNSVIRERMDERQKKIDMLKLQVDKVEWKQIIRFFSFMKQNSFEQLEHKMFLTEQSIRMTLSKYFGHKTDLLNKRFYYVLSGGKSFQRIFLDDFLENFYMPLFESQDSFDRAKFMFRLMDFDNDGYLHASDMI